jgi:hypothetical protein
MKIKLSAPVSNQNVEIDIPDNVKKIGILLSGGADSAILLYILCKHIQENNLDVTVLPITSCVIAKPVMVEGTFRVTNKIRELFNYNIPFLLDNFLYFRGRKVFKYDIVAQINLLKEGVVDYLIGAGTTFASEEVLKQNNMWDDRPVYRALDYVPTHYDYLIPGNDKYKIYKPFLRVDKKFVAEMYDLYGVRESLLSVTKSCIANFSMSEGWSKPCKTCWWCKERFWAFGEYDHSRRTYLENIKKEVYSWNPTLPTDDSDKEWEALRKKNLESGR